MTRTPRIALAGLCLLVAACSTVEQSTKIDYRSAAKGPALDVPPDLTQLTRDSRYAMPGGGPISASGQAGPSRATDAPTAATALGDVRIERAGSQRWLVVNRTADQLWTPIQAFWKENGFTLTLDQAALGIMETDWAENRAKLPQDMVRNLLGRVLDSFYSTSERDRFRTRLERRGDGATEIYISHRGLQEVYADSSNTRTVWQPRPADPELEAEFLRRLMVKLGASSEQARAATASAPAQPAARVAKAGDVPVVQMDEGFDRAWRRVGLSLDRTGFTVEDRNRAQGTFFVRYVAPNPDRQGQGGVLGRLMPRSSKPADPVRYRIAVRSEGESTTVSVLTADGRPDTSATAQRIVQLLADDLK